MKHFLSKILLIFIFITTTNCGFKVVNKPELKNIYFKEISSSGDKRVNFKIKNFLLNNSNLKGDNTLHINLESKLKKIIKEKNINNENKKYEITLVVNFTIDFISKEKQINFQSSVKGDYIVGKYNSITLNNEKTLIENLIENVSEDILNTIRLNLDDI